MQKYFGWLQKRGGPALAGAVVSVETYPGGVPVTLYSDDGVTVIPLLATDEDGYYEFYISAGTYTIVFEYDGTEYKRITNVVMGSAGNIADFATDLAASSGSSLVGFLQSGTGAVPRTIQSKLRDVVSVKDFGAVGDGTTDDTDAIQAALDAHSHVHFPAGTYLHTGILLNSGNTLSGDGWGATTLYLDDESNTHSLFGSSTDDVTIRNLKVFGNKTNQTGGNNGRGIYFISPSATCSRIHLENVWVDSCEDHGVFFSTNAGLDSGIYHCISTNNGDGTGPGGTGFLLGRGAYLVGCYAEGNDLNGFKSASGVHIGCTSKNNSGGFETGSDSYVAGQDYATFQNCRVISCGGGFRNQGQAHWLMFSNCVADGCDLSGLDLVNGVEKVIINGFISRNNGQDFTRSEIVGGDGISIIESSGQPMDILIDNFLLIDDQGSPTQDYGIYIDADAANVNIGSGIIRGNVTAPLRINVNNTNDIRISPQCIGLDVNQQELGDVSVTGTTALTTLRTVTIPTRTLIHPGTVLIVRGGGAASGTAGTKTVRLAVAAGSDIISSQTAGEEQVFGFEFRLKWESASTVHILGQCTEDGGATVNLAKRQTANMTGDITITVNGQLGDGADTITLNWFEVVTER